MKEKNGVITTVYFRKYDIVTKIQGVPKYVNSSSKLDFIVEDIKAWPQLYLTVESKDAEANTKLAFGFGVPGPVHDHLIV